MKAKNVLVIGAGLTGATVARRLADEGYSVTVLEKEDYVGGTVADVKEDDYYKQIHGPHLFHTNSDRAYEFLSRFTEWFEYRHTVRALVDGKYIPVPFNFTSLEMLHEKADAERMEKKLTETYGEGGAVSISEMRESADPEIKAFAEEVYKTVFEYYSAKQWGMDMSKIDPAVLKRVPVRTSYTDGYFADKYQAMPKNGFSAIVENMLKSPNITVKTGVDALKILAVKDGKVYADGKAADYPVVFTGCLDALMKYEFDALPYRTLRFEFEKTDREEYQPFAVVNYTVSEDFTRISEFKKFTVEKKSQSKQSLIVREYPLAYEGQKELSPYYPLPTKEAREQFERYKAVADGTKNLYLAGRLGRYVYVNMDRAVDDALTLADKIIAENGADAEEAEKEANNETRKPRVVFPFVEAGMGHIMPITAVSTEFERKYGDKCEVIKTYFFQDTKNPDMKAVEDDLVVQVRKHNHHRINGIAQFAAMALVGQRNAMNFVYRRRYKKGYKPALDYMMSLKPDLVLNTHFSTLYYANECRDLRGLDADIVAYCPDPIVGRQWDKRSDLIALSSENGRKKAVKLGLKDSRLITVPFLLRKNVESFDKGKEYYREQLGFDKDRFTVLLVDGAYGEGKLEKTAEALVKSDMKLTVIAVCGKNEPLFNRLSALKTNENVDFKVYGFTDKILALNAAADLFVGKSGASNLAESSYLEVPQIITLYATSIEKWIGEYYIDEVGTAIKITNIGKIVKKIREFYENPLLMEPYKKACLKVKTTAGGEVLADILFERLKKRFPQLGE